MAAAARVAIPTNTSTVGECRHCSGALFVSTTKRSHSEPSRHAIPVARSLSSAPSPSGVATAKLQVWP
jgi:hypothetical protein